MSAPMDERRAAAALERALSRMESGRAPEPALDGGQGDARAELEAKIALAGALRGAELPPLPAEDVERIGAALSEAAGGAGRPPSSGGATVGRALWVLAALGLLLGLLLGLEGGAWWRERGVQQPARSTSLAEAPAPAHDGPTGATLAGSDAAGTDGPRQVLVPEPTRTASLGGRLPEVSPRPLHAERTARRATARAAALPTASPSASRTPGATALAPDPGAPMPGALPRASASPTPSRPSARPSPTATASPSPMRSATPTAARTATPSPTASATPPPTPSPTATPTGTGTPSPSPSPSPSPTPDEAWLEVRVTDRDGVPIAGASVEAPAEDGRAGASAETDGDGVARLGLRTGVGYRVRAAAEGFWPRWYDDVESRADATVVRVRGGAVEDIAIRLGRQAAGADGAASESDVTAGTADATRRGPGSVRPARSRSGARPTSLRVGVPTREDGAGGDARAGVRFAISRRPA